MPQKLPAFQGRAEAWGLDKIPGSSLLSVVNTADRQFLLSLQLQALQYFLDNQLPSGLVLDRQHNHGPLRMKGLCSTTATGMGFIALALASAPPYRLLTLRTAVQRICNGLGTALHLLPHNYGMMPHFVDADTYTVVGHDHFSTVDSTWLIAGGLWAAAYLRDVALEALAEQLYRRVDWYHWTDPDANDSRCLLRHGKRGNGRFLPCYWDRLNGETVAMYVLGVGAETEDALPVASWSALQPFYGMAAGLRFPSADLGLFVHQYGMDLLNFRQWHVPGGIDLWTEARRATIANERVCRNAADTFTTYRRFWGLSAGDGPADTTKKAWRARGVKPLMSADFTYRCYSPAGPLDGTAHLTATLASVVHHPGAVLENLRQAEHDRELKARGRYGYSNVNLDRRWRSSDMVGIDAGAVVLALDNLLMEDRVRSVFHSLPCVQRGLQRLGFRKLETGPARDESERTRLAS